ncbi:poly-gamma-glutamate hydrolase family protein [Natrialba sp. PRR66]|uniref:poly-gamma-glutamate hydrolase family protein n=1 Tax=Natrialba sp. PRR66 TaxID=3098146 RepID=UPI002B1D91B2|nr:poly-gamma-glutamate hydrolase family protein [Natrialba sp. PRR66]
MGKSENGNERSDTERRTRSRRQIIAAGAGLTGIGALTTGAGQIIYSRVKAQSESGQEVYAGGCENVDHWEATFEAVTADWGARSSSEQYCSVPCQWVENERVMVGQQIRIGREATADGFENAVYTVASNHEGEMLRLTASGLDRIGASDSSTGAVGAQAAHPDYDTRQAGELNDEFVEYGIEGDGVVVIAPHGGYIEYGTDFQASRVAEAVDGAGWICSGFNDGGGAFTRWHTYSTELHRRSFPALDALLDQQFDWSVAFHGYADDGVLIGGTAERSDKDTVKDAIAERLPDRTVEIVDRDATAYTGANPENVLNELAPIGRTIQIEQATDIRQSDWAAVADGVTDAIESLRA